MPILDADRHNLTPLIIKRISSLFVQLRWPIDHSDESYLNCYNHYCEMLSLLNNDEQELILQLTEDFLHCTYSKYPIILEQALSNIDQNLVESCSEIILIPLLAPKDFGKTKSSSALLYSALHVVIPRLNIFKEKKISAYEHPHLLSEKRSDRKDALILILDDFIGTGETADEAIDYFEAELRIESDKPVVAALVAQEAGYNRIRDRGIKIVATHIRKRGISDSERFHDIAEALRIMTGIEEYLGVKRKYKHGYKGSEALVSMIRTPNNTFPVFWRNKRSNGKPWPAPFQR